MKISPKITVLHNGLIIITDQMKGYNQVAIDVNIDVGSRYEKDHERGVSHFVEHMMFKGTPTYTASQLHTTVEGMGASYNAWTATESTDYQMSCLKEDVGSGLDILGDMLTHSLLDSEELEKERKVVINEIKSREDSPTKPLRDAWWGELVYGECDLTKPICGSVESITDMSRDILVDYIRKHYTTSNCIISVTGDVDHNEVVDRVQSAFGDMPTSTLKSNYSSVIYKGGERRIEKDSLEKLYFSLGWEGVNCYSPEKYTKTLLDIILGRGMSSRLHLMLREKYGLFYSLGSWENIGRDYGLFGVSGNTEPDDGLRLFTLLKEELQRCTNTITQEEVDKAIKRQTVGILFGEDSAWRRCCWNVSNMRAYGRIKSREEVVAHFQKVTVDDVQQYAEKLFNSPPTFVTLGKTTDIPLWKDI